jgi:hypothetical protein
MIPNNLMCIGLLALLSLPRTAAIVYPLFAGKHTQVGTVTVEPALSPGQISLEYVMFEGWCATHVHIHANEGNDPIPVNRQGNPKVGKFEINEPQSCSSGKTFTMMGADCGTSIDIGFHANVESEFLWDLPITDRTVTMQAIRYPGTSNEPSYWDIEIEGTPFDAWCVDFDRYMSAPDFYNVTMWSSLDDALPFDANEYPGNFSKVNWILNQDFVNTLSDCDGEYYTYLDVQEAIWRLIENHYSAIGNDCRVTEIVAAANADEAENGEFVPGCGDDVAIVLIPTGENQRIIAQVLVAQVEISCGHQKETAWAAMGPGPGGKQFVDGKNWGTFIEYPNDEECRRLLRGV